MSHPTHGGGLSNYIHEDPHNKLSLVSHSFLGESGIDIFARFFLLVTLF